MAEARIFKFCMYVGRLYKIVAYDDKPPLKWNPFSKFCSNHIFVIGEARHCPFYVLIDTKEYECMHDILLTKMCSESRDLFKLGK